MAAGTNRNFNAGTSGPPVSSIQYIFDPNQISPDGGSTGQWKPERTLDLVLSATTTANTITTGSAGQTIASGQFAANPNRINFYIQNVGSGSPLYVNLGTGFASQQAFSLILGAATTDFGGNGGIFSDQGFWRGPVTFSGQTRVVAWEATP